MALIVWLQAVGNGENRQQTDFWTSRSGGAVQLNGLHLSKDKVRLSIHSVVCGLFLLLLILPPLSSSSILLLPPPPPPPPPFFFFFFYLHIIISFCPVEFDLDPVTADEVCQHPVLPGRDCRWVMQGHRGQLDSGCGERVVARLRLLADDAVQVGGSDPAQRGHLVA